MISQLTEFIGICFCEVLFESWSRHILFRPLCFCVYLAWFPEGFAIFPPFSTSQHSDPSKIPLCSLCSLRPSNGFKCKLLLSLGGVSFESPRVTTPFCLYSEIFCTRCSTPAPTPRVSHTPSCRPPNLHAGSQLSVAPTYFHSILFAHRSHYHAMVRIPVHLVLEPYQKALRATRLRLCISILSDQCTVCIISSY